MQNKSFRVLNKPIYFTDALEVQNNLRANGMSYSNLLYKDKSRNIQDANKSRRVEFKVVVKAEFKKS